MFFWRWATSCMGWRLRKLILAKVWWKCLCAVRRFRWSWIKKVMPVMAVQFRWSVRPAPIIGPALVGKPKSQVKPGTTPNHHRGMDLSQSPRGLVPRFSLAWNILRRLELVALSRLNSISACKSILPIRPVYRRSVKLYAAKFPRSRPQIFQNTSVD